MIKKTLSYNDANGVRHDSYYCVPENAKNCVGVLVAPEWWGITDGAKQAAEKLANLGYAALAVDVYGEGKITADAQQASQWMNAVTDDVSVLVARAQEALDALAAQPEVDKNCLAAIGYCFGGKTVLELARSGADIKALTTFHGNVSTDRPAQKGVVKAKMLIEHGNADSMVSLEDVDAFKKEMDQADVDYHIDYFDGAKHGFTSPEADKKAKENGIDVGYQKEAAEQSWANMCQFFDRVFK